MYKPAAFGEIQRMNPELVGFPVVKGEADVGELHDLMQARSDRGKELAQIEFRDHGVVHFEQQA
jgi:hypothetical protein